jgi:hypothetical protein
MEQDILDKPFLPLDRLRTLKPFSAYHVIINNVLKILAVRVIITFTITEQVLRQLKKRDDDLLPDKTQQAIAV